MIEHGVRQVVRIQKYVANFFLIDFVSAFFLSHITCCVFLPLIAMTQVDLLNTNGRIWQAAEECDVFNSSG
jgi:hypothetical protein